MVEPESRGPTIRASLRWGRSTSCAIFEGGQSAPYQATNARKVKTRWLTEALIYRATLNDPEVLFRLAANIPQEEVKQSVRGFKLLQQTLLVHLWVRWVARREECKRLQIDGHMVVSVEREKVSPFEEEICRVNKAALSRSLKGLIRQGFLWRHRWQGRFFFTPLGLAAAQYLAPRLMNRQRLT